MKRIFLLGIAAILGFSEPVLAQSKLITVTINITGLCQTPQEFTFDWNTEHIVDTDFNKEINFSKDKVYFLTDLFANKWNSV